MDESIMLYLIKSLMLQRLLRECPYAHIIAATIATTLNFVIFFIVAYFDHSCTPIMTPNFINATHTPHDPLP